MCSISYAIVPVYVSRRCGSAPASVSPWQTLHWLMYSAREPVSFPLEARAPVQAMSFELM